jgi:hypothetical protein
MKRTDGPIVESTQRICDLYYDNVRLREVVDLMKCQSINDGLVECIYHQLSTNAYNITKKRFDHYEVDFKTFDNYNVDYWTSRYLFAHGFKSADSHEIQIIDVFNDKSM